MDRQTVLVVESDELIRDLLTELLEGDGYAVLEAAGGAQALRLLEEHVPTVVLLDQRLTDMSGLDVLKRQRAYAPCSRIPVIRKNSNHNRSSPSQAAKSLSSSSRS